MSPALNFAIQVGVVWSVARIIVRDDVFEGSRHWFMQRLINLIGVGQSSVKPWTLRGIEGRAKRSRDAQAFKGRTKAAASRRAQWIGVRYRASKNDNAATQYMWLVVGVVYTKLNLNSPQWLWFAWWHRVFALLRLLAQKIHTGIQCMYCVSVWVAAPVAWIWGPHGFKLWFLWWMGTAGVARIIMQTQESLEGG